MALLFRWRLLLHSELSFYSVLGMILAAELAGSRLSHAHERPQKLSVALASVYVC